MRSLWRRLPAIARCVVPMVLVGSVYAAAQTPTPRALDAKASDPVASSAGWSAIHRPRQVDPFADGSFFRFPQTRWSFSHYRELVPTRAVSRGHGPVVPLPRSERKDLDGMTVQSDRQSATMTWAQSLDANYTDGIVVLHRGRIVYERYFGALDAIARTSRSR